MYTIALYGGMAKGFLDMPVKSLSMLQSLGVVRNGISRITTRFCAGIEH
jgi:hypothetical protein